MFTELLDTIDIEIVKSLSSVTINEKTQVDEIEQQDNEQAQTQHDELGTTGVDDYEVETVQQQDKLKFEKVGRNEECPCGSGKKYKNCHG
jgi:preprotein translocase subunit SecA